MAAITSSAVTFVRSFEYSDISGSTKEKVSDLIISLNGQGGTVGDIPASVLGFAKIYTAEAEGFNSALSAPYNTANDSGGWVACLSDGSGLIGLNIGTGAKANVTGSIFLRISGTPKL